MNERPLHHTIVLALLTGVLGWATKCLAWAHDNATGIALGLTMVASLAAIWHGIPAGLNQWRKYLSKGKGDE